MKKLTIVVAAVAFAGTAQAADLYVKAPVAAAYDWSGIYIGANAGGGWGDETWAFPTANYFLQVAPASFTTHPTGALAGGQIGAQKEIGPGWLFGLPWVVGVELTGDWASLRQSQTGVLDPHFPNDVWTTKVHDLETLAFRSGWAWNNWLFYTKSGGATANVSVNALSGPPGAGVTFDQSQRLWGITSGAGIEYGLTRNWIVGVEYDYTHLWAGQFNGPTSLNHGAVAFGASTAFTVQSVVGRVSYKF
jgi:outer membrane immunogenic protein